MRLEIENQIFFFNLVNKGHKVDIFNKEISSIDFFALVQKGLKMNVLKRYICHWAVVDLHGEYNAITFLLYRQISNIEV